MVNALLEILTTVQATMVEVRQALTALNTISINNIYIYIGVFVRVCTCLRTCVRIGYNNIMKGNNSRN